MERGETLPQPTQRTLSKLGARLAWLDQALGLGHGNFAASPTPHHTSGSGQTVGVVGDPSGAPDKT